MLNKIVIGGAQLGLKYGYNKYNTPVNKSELEKILNVANNNNINKIDTAISYGQSENIIGSFGIGIFCSIA